MAKADFTKAKDRYPSTGQGISEWVAVFDANPDIMWKIVADIFASVKDEEERAAGVRRMGRRPQRSANSMAEVYAAVFPPQYTTDAFPLALKAIIGNRSQRQFAQRVPCNQSVISRLLTGEVTPDMAMLEAVAAAAKVPPHFFVEYRALLVSGQVLRIMTEKPNVGIAALKQLRAARKDLA